MCVVGTTIFDHCHQSVCQPSPQIPYPELLFHSRMSLSTTAAVGSLHKQRARSQASLHDRLSRWERKTGGTSLAPLTAEQQDLVMDIAIHVDQRPVPAGLVNPLAPGPPAFICSR